MTIVTIDSLLSLFPQARYWVLPSMIYINFTERSLSLALTPTHNPMGGLPLDNYIKCEFLCKNKRITMFNPYCLRFVVFF